MSEVWHGSIAAVEATGIFVTIPRLMGQEVLGPVMTAVPSLAVGDRVVGAQIGPGLNELIVLARTEPEYVTASVGTVMATPDTIMRRGVSGSTIVQNIYLNGTQSDPNRAVSKSELDGQKHSGADITTGTVSAARLPVSTTTAAGTMSAADKSKLDNATAGPTVSRLVIRDAAGRAQFADPNLAGDAATKGYVDNRTYPSTAISDSTAVGRSLVTAPDAGAARAAIGAGTSSLVLGTGPTTAMPGDRTFTFADISGMVPTSALPPLAINETYTVASQAAMLALTAERGDMAIRTDNGGTYVLSSDAPGTLADWKELMAAGQVQSVAGKTGVVSLVKADVGLGSVDNTADSAKPVSGPMQAALDLKAASVHAHAIADVTGLQAALDSKASENGAWAALSLLNAWAAYSGGGNYHNGANYRVGGGYVEIAMMVKSGATGTVIATLPGGARPLYTQFYGVTVSNSTGTRSYGTVTVDVNGNITYDSGIAAPLFLHLTTRVPLT